MALVGLMGYMAAIKIAEINDSFRQNFTGGRVVMTAGIIHSLNDAERTELIRRVKSFDNFNTDNDPHHEHDFGVIEVAGVTCFWKIDYYSPDMQLHSDDPANIEITNRVLTIMCASEY